MDQNPPSPSNAVVAKPNVRRTYPRLAFMVLPYTRAELPGWGRLLKWMGVKVGIHDTSWRSAPTVAMRGKWHHHQMSLDLSDWAQRMTYFIGRYYELGVQHVLDAALRPGDHFADIGANIGMITLHAQRSVGPSGRISCFEPNPDCVRAIKHHLRLNNISNVTVHPCALSDVPGSLGLNFTSESTGTATLADVEGTRRRVAVDVRVGDHMLSNVDMIKIDVEGFELHVLKGLSRTLAACRPLVITELVEPQLNKAGTSVREVAGHLFDLGYEAYGIATARRMLRHDLKLHRLERGGSFDRFDDVLWVHPASDRREALVAYMVGPDGRLSQVARPMGQGE